METAVNKIPIKAIARLLGIRPMRLNEKVHKLDLSVHSDMLTINSAVELVGTYVHNNKVSKTTKDRATELLYSLKNGSVNVPITPKKMKSRINGGRPYSTKEKPYTASLQKHMLFYQKLKSAVHETVQLGVHALESTNFKFVALIIAICVQMQHSAQWYGRIVPEGQNNVYAAYGYAFMVDLFILVVTMEGRVSIAKTFAVLTFLANILYFQFWVNFDGSGQAYTNAVSSILISGTIAYIIYANSELFVKHRNAKQAL